MKIHKCCGCGTEFYEDRPSVREKRGNQEGKNGRTEEGKGGKGKTQSVLGVALAAARLMLSASRFAVKPLTGCCRRRIISIMDKLLETVLDEVLARLKPLSLSRVILFGSHAQGCGTSDSDIDLLVVLDRDDLPRTHQQKTQLDLSVLRPLRDIRQRFAMDIIVHTKAMYYRFLAGNSVFALEIQQTGVTVYEAGDAGMA